MSLLLPVPEQSSSEVKLQLAGILYTFIYSFNTRDGRWRFDLFIEDEPVIFGVKIMENQSLLDRYALPEFDHGDIFCLRVGSSTEDVGRDNLGFEKNYQLFYFSNEELA